MIIFQLKSQKINNNNDLMWVTIMESLCEANKAAGEVVFRVEPNRDMRSQLTISRILSLNHLEGTAVVVYEVGEEEDMNHAFNLMPASDSPITQPQHMPTTIFLG